MQLQKFFVILSSLLVINGCSVLEPKVVTKTEYVAKNIPLQPPPKPLTLSNVEWSVVTKDTLEEVLAKMQEPYVFYAISVPSYEVMALNLAEIKRYIGQQKAIITYYENAIQPAKPPEKEK